MGHKIRVHVKNVQVSLVITPLTPVVGPSEHSCPKVVQYDTRYPWIRSIPGVQQIILNFV